MNGGHTLTDTSDPVFSSRNEADWRHYLRLAANAFATMLDIGLFAVAAALVGLAAAVILAGFGIVDGVVDLSTGALLVSSLVLGVVGCFAAGIASEGPIRRNRRVVGNNNLEVAIARAASALVVGLIFLYLAGRLEPIRDDLSAPLVTGIDLLSLAGRVGLWVMPLIGVPLALGVKVTELLGEAVEETELPVLFVVWVAGMMLLG
ncbi:MAG: hypothetical protein Q8Q52_01865 [Acidimicrobiia bacterium]|nr:hypothetical protein [Acidimicrobiia bacterium]